MTPKAKACTLLICLLLGACASRRPADADFRSMAIQAAPAQAEQPAARTKAETAVSSAVKGGAGGLAVGAVICALLVPVAIPACVGVVAPTTVTAGASVGGVIGGAVAKNTDLAPPELSARLDTATAQQRLVELLRQRAADRVATPAAKGAEGAAPAYTLVLTLADLRMQHVQAGRPAALVLLAQAQIQQAGSDTPAWTRTFRIVGKDRRAAAEWAQAPDGAAIELLLEGMADHIADTLSPRRS